MNAVDWTRLRSLFESLCDLPADEQARQLVAVHLDAELQQRLQAMLEGDRAGRLRSDARAQAPTLTQSLAQDELVNAMLGHYRIEALIGVGGMGRVYRARREDGRFEGKVAVKFVAEGASAERFRREREVLGRLTHPGIARLLDADEDAAGRPYLVMEYVEGDPVDRYCNGRGLSDLERIRLIIEATRAIAYAHERLVLHRDLKPANILVDAQGRVKILDFGIAKLIGVESTDPSQTAARFFTLRYAAPEQIAGEPVGMAADIFALAVMLYELLSGRHPFLEREEDLPALAERVLTTESIPLRTALRRAARVPGLQGDRLRDLEAVLGKAMVRNPALSYGSAREFGDDLQRVVDDRAVSVRALAWRAATWRWLRRHRVVAVALAVALLSLFLGLGAALWQADVARSERDAAWREAARSERMAQFLTGMFEAAQPLQNRGADLKARDLIDRGRQRLTQELGDEPVLRAQLLATMADSYRALGLYEESEKVLDDALSIEVPALEREPLHARLNAQLGRVHNFQGRWQQADARLNAALALSRKQGLSDVTQMALRSLATTRINQQRWEEAATAAAEALQILRSDIGRNRRAIADAEMLLATIAFGKGDLRAARDAYLRLVDTQRDEFGPDALPLMTSLNNLAAMQTRLGDLASAEGNYRESARLGRHHFGDSNREEALPLMGLGMVLRAQGKFDEALATLSRAQEIYFGWAGDDDANTAYARLLHAELLWLLDRDAEALAALGPADRVLYAKSGKRHVHSCRAALLRAALVGENIDRPQPGLQLADAIASCKSGAQAAPNLRLMARWAELRHSRSESASDIEELRAVAIALSPRDAALTDAIKKWAAGAVAADSTHSAVRDAMR